MNAKTNDAAARAEFGDLQDKGMSDSVRDVNMEVILDVPVTLSMEVGRTRIPIRNLLQLNQGSVVELDRAAGEPLDVFVNGTLVAHGEVVGLIGLQDHPARQVATAGAPGGLGVISRSPPRHSLSNP